MTQPLKKGALLALIIVFLLAGAAIILGENEHRPPRTWPDALDTYLGEPAYKSVDPDKPLDEQTVVFEMAGRVLEMPTVYIQSNIAGKDELDGINLLYVLPDYRSRADFRDKQEYEAVRKQRRFAHMMLEPSAVRPSFDIMIQNRRRGIDKEEAKGIWQGLERYDWYQTRGNALIRYYEIYIERDNQGKILSFIECATDERPSVKFPGCNHKFRDNHLLYDIYYNKDNYLESWRSQRTSAIAFIDQFEISTKHLTKGD